MRHKTIFFLLFVSTTFASLSAQTTLKGISIGIPGIVNFAPFYGPYDLDAGLGEKLINKVSNNLGYVVSYHFQAKNGRQWFLTQQSTLRPYINDRLDPQRSVFWRSTLRVGGGRMTYFFHQPDWQFFWELGLDVGKRWNYNVRFPRQLESPLSPYFGLHLHTTKLGEHLNLGASLEARIHDYASLILFNLNATWSIQSRQPSQDTWYLFMSDQHTKLNFKVGFGTYMRDVARGRPLLSHYYGAAVEYRWWQKNGLSIGTSLGIGEGDMESIFSDNYAYTLGGRLLSLGNNAYWRPTPNAIISPYLGVNIYLGINRSDSPPYELFTLVFPPLIRTGVQLGKPHHRCFLELGINSSPGVELGLGLRFNTIRRSKLISPTN